MTYQTKSTWMSSGKITYLDNSKPKTGKNKIVIVYQTHWFILLIFLLYLHGNFNHHGNIFNIYQQTKAKRSLIIVYSNNYNLLSWYLRVSDITVTKIHQHNCEYNVALAVWILSLRDKNGMIDVENIEAPNHIKPKSLKFHIKPALIYSHSLIR